MATLQRGTRASCTRSPPARAPRGAAIKRSGNQNDVSPSLQFIETGEDNRDSSLETRAGSKRESPRLARDPGRVCLVLRRARSSCSASHTRLPPTVPVRLEFVVRPPLGAGPSPLSGRSNGHCSARHGPPCVRRRRSTARGPSTTRGCVPRWRRPDARRHATLPQSWIQRENWEFETHRASRTGGITHGDQ